MKRHKPDDSAYTGKGITWTDLLTSTNRLGPTQYALGPVPTSRSLPWRV